MKNITKEELEKLYITDSLNPYQIAEKLDCDHKTVRKYLKVHGVNLRTASEYNFLAKKSHSTPTEEKLKSLLSVAGHMTYLCEGWHTAKTDSISFCNQDPNIIDMMIRFFLEIYTYSKPIKVKICAKSREDALHFLTIYPEASFSKDPSRKNPILRIVIGGKNMARELIQNAYNICSSLS